METWKESLFKRALSKWILWKTNRAPYMKREVFAAYKALFEVIEDLGLIDEFNDFCRMMIKE